MENELFKFVTSNPKIVIYSAIMTVIVVTFGIRAGILQIKKNGNSSSDANIDFQFMKKSDYLKAHSAIESAIDDLAVKVEKQNNKFDVMEEYLFKPLKGLMEKQIELLNKILTEISKRKE